LECDDPVPAVEDEPIARMLTVSRFRRAAAKLGSAAGAGNSGL